MPSLFFPLFTLLTIVAFLRHPASAQLQGIGAAAPQVKISSQPFPVTNTQHMSQIVWTLLGKNSYTPIYCVSETPVSQLRFVCVDCAQKNITGITAFLNSAEDQSALTNGFPLITLGLGPVAVEANPTWNGVTIICQAAINGGTVDSPPSTLIIKYLRQPHVVDGSGSGPVQIQNQGLRFYVECVRGSDGLCQSTRRKTLRCAVDSYPPANTYRWLKNGLPFGGSGPEITIGVEMIGQSIQCSANNGLYGDDNVPTSPSIFIEQYTSARVISDNFLQVQTSQPFQSGNKVEMNQNVQLSCVVEGNPRPVVFWKLRRSNGQVVDAACPQGLNAQYRENFQNSPPSIQQPNTIRLSASCDLTISNYSFSGHYWCSACSFVSNGSPECSPGMDSPGDRSVNIVVQGPPMQADMEPTIEHNLDQNSANLIIHYCADPAPKPPREVVFSIDGNDVRLHENWQNFLFEGFYQNNTVPNCYFAKLKISPIHDSDQRRVVLKLQNQYGVKQITIPLSDLLGGDASEIGGMPGWLAVILVLLAFAVVVSLVVIFCMRMNLFCFDQIKDNQTNYSSDKLKPSDGGYIEAADGHRGLYGNGMNGHSTTVNEQERLPISTIQKQQLRAKPAFYSSHESLNFAMMHLAENVSVVKYEYPPPISEPRRQTMCHFSSATKPQHSNVINATATTFSNNFNTEHTVFP